MNVNRYDCIAAIVTLDGKAAKVAGTKNDFATVRTLDGSVECEWAWETVARIVATGGDFRS